MIGHKDEGSSMWLGRTITGIVLLLFLTGIVSWATGIGTSINAAQIDIVRIDNELTLHEKQALVDRSEQRAAFDKLDKKLDRLIELH